jgi:hypothetical protein
VSGREAKGGSIWWGGKEAFGREEETEESRGVAVPREKKDWRFGTYKILKV